ncbi:MAG: hypothetical protein U0R26_06250 [Solirubrobacterales bacterium]
MHTALWVLAAVSVIGAGVSLLRPGEESVKGARRPSPTLAIEEAIAEEIEATP